MNATALMKDIDRRYREYSGLSDIRYYKIFFSRLQSADVLVAGINPAGNPEDWPEEVRQYYPGAWIERVLANDFWFEKDEHEYVNCRYPIQQTMLTFVTDILQATPNDIRNVPKINLAFRRTPRTDNQVFRRIHGMTLTGAQQEARPFVEEILKYVKPRVILLEGITGLEAFRRGFCSRGFGSQLAEPIWTDWRGSRARIFAGCEMYIDCLQRPVAAVALGHPSSFGNKPEFHEATIAARKVVQAVLGKVTPRRSKQKSRPQRKPIKPAQSKAAETVAKPGPTRLEDKLVVQRGECVIKVSQITPKRFCLEVYNGDDRIGEYERSGEGDIERKKDEIEAAFNFLLNIYKKHGEWVVRWDGTERQKSVRVEGQEVAILPKDYWGRPSWER